MSRRQGGGAAAAEGICFSWRLMQDPDGAVDYVVVHELAHRTEMNHSRNFWRIVEQVLPDYQERRRRLKEMSNKL